MQHPAASPQGVTFEGLRDTIESVKRNKDRARDALTPLNQIATELMGLNRDARDSTQVAVLLGHVQPYMQYLQDRVSSKTLDSDTAVGHIDRLSRLLTIPEYNLGEILPDQQLQQIKATLHQQKQHIKATAGSGAAAPPPAAAAALRSPAGVQQQRMPPPITPAKRARGAAAAKPSAVGSNGGSGADSDTDEAESGPAQRTQRQAALPAVAESLVHPSPAAAGGRATAGGRVGREGAAAPAAAAAGGRAGRGSATAPAGAAGAAAAPAAPAGAGAAAAAAAGPGTHTSQVDPATFDVYALRRLIEQKSQVKAASMEWTAAIAALPALANGRYDGKGVLLTELPKHLPAILNLWSNSSSGRSGITLKSSIKYCGYMCRLLEMSEVQQVLGEQQVQQMKQQVTDMRATLSAAGAAGAAGQAEEAAADTPVAAPVGPGSTRRQGATAAGAPATASHQPAAAAAGAQGAVPTAAAAASPAHAAAATPAASIPAAAAAAAAVATSSAAAAAAAGADPAPAQAPSLDSGPSAGAGTSLVQAERTLLPLCNTMELLEDLEDAMGTLKSLGTGAQQLQTFWQEYAYIHRAMQLPAATQEDKTRRDAYVSRKLRRLLNSVLGRQ